MKKDLAKISKWSYDNEGNLKPFKVLLIEFKNNKIPVGSDLLVSENSKNLKYANINDCPIVITQNTLRKITTGKHSNINKQIIYNLDKELKTSVLAMDSITHKNAKIIVLNKFDILNNPIVAIIHINKTNAKIKINEITSVYDKNDFQKFINNTLKNGKNIYTNEKTEKWLLLSGLQLPTRFTNNSVLE